MTRARFTLLVSVRLRVLAFPTQVKTHIQWEKLNFCPDGERNFSSFRFSFLVPLKQSVRSLDTFVERRRTERRRDRQTDGRTGRTRESGVFTTDLLFSRREIVYEILYACNYTYKHDNRNIHVNLCPCTCESA